MSTHHTLVLTPWMAVHAIFDWREAIVAQYKGKVDVLEIYPETVSSVSVTYNIPAVIRLKTSVGLKRTKRGLKFSRSNLFSRDSFTCQYCGVKKGFKQLNYDHVLPRAQGGKTTWTNIVSSCFTCNTKKDNRTPEQAKMPLLKKPAIPTQLPMTPPILSSISHIPEEWKFYITDDSVVLGRTG